MRGGAPAIRSTPQDLPEGIPNEGTSERAPVKARERGLLLVEVLGKGLVRPWPQLGKHLVRQGDSAEAFGKKTVRYRTRRKPGTENRQTMAEKLGKNPVRQGALVEAWGANVCFGNALGKRFSRALPRRKI